MRRRTQGRIGEGLQTSAKHCRDNLCQVLGNIWEDKNALKAHLKSFLLAGLDNSSRKTPQSFDRRFRLRESLKQGKPVSAAERMIKHVAVLGNVLLCGTSMGAR